MLTSFADLSGRAVPSSLGCPQESCQEASANPVFTVSAFLGPREGRRQDLGSNTCSPSSVHVYSGAPAAGFILHCPASSSRNPQWDGEGKSPKGQDRLPAPRGQRAEPGPSPAAPHLPAQRGDHEHAEPSPQVRTYSPTVFEGSRGCVLGLGDSERVSSVAPKIAFPERCCPNQHHSGEKSLVWKDTCSRPGMPHKNALRSSLISV